MKKNLKEKGLSIWKSFTTGILKLKSWYGRNHYTRFTFQIIPLKLKVYLNKDRYNVREFCQKPFCFQMLRFMEEGFCVNHATNPPKAKVTTRVIWSSRQNTERDKHAKALIQPFLNDGTVNPLYVKVYGDPRRDPKMRHHPRNIFHKRFKENAEVNKMLERFEARKRI